jgi:hypothetical protein
MLRGMSAEREFPEVLDARDGSAIALLPGEAEVYREMVTVAASPGLMNDGESAINATILGAFERLGRLTVRRLEEMAQEAARLQAVPDPASDAANYDRVRDDAAERLYSGEDAD